jgi:hypothetical protein
MSDTTRTDHAAAIRGMTEGYILDGNGPFAQGGGLAGIRIHVDALAAERDALRAYARALEHVAIRGAQAGEFTRLRAEHDVDGLMGEEVAE